MDSYGTPAHMYAWKGVYSTVHTCLSFNLVIPEEMYTRTHLHTYEAMQTGSHKLLSLVYSRGRSPQASSLVSEAVKGGQNGEITNICKQTDVIRSEEADKTKP